MVAMLWRRVVIVINSDNYPGLTEMDSWPEKILLLELKKIKRFAQCYLDGFLRVKTECRTYFIRLVDRFTSETNKLALVRPDPYQQLIEG